MVEEAQSSATPLITVGLPVRNGERYLRDALDSVLAQTYANFELVISDNASTDDTQAICESYAQRDTRIRYTRQSRDLGVRGAGRFVVGQARGEYFTWLSHDDLLRPRFLERCLEKFKDHENVVIVCCDFQDIDADGAELATHALDQIRETIPWPIRRREFFKCPHVNVYYAIYGLMRTAMCQAAMTWWKDWKILDGAEHPVLARYALEGEIFAIPEILRDNRLHPESMYFEQLARASKWPMGRDLYHAISAWVHRADHLALALRSDLSSSEKFGLAFGLLDHSAREASKQLRLTALRGVGKTRALASKGVRRITGGSR